MTRANHDANSKRTFEASAFTMPAARLHPVQRRSSNEADQLTEQEASINAAGPYHQSPDLKPSVIMRLIQVLKDL
jgi:hypothetical protein